MIGLFVYGLPAGALLIGAVAFLLAIRDSRAFDRAYGKTEVKAVRDLFDTQARHP